MNSVQFKHHHHHPD
ncbi:his operon leader peptide [Raoultella planticola]